MRKPSLVYILSISIVLLLVSLCAAQNKIRTVEKYAFSDSPIEVVRLELGNKSFMDDTRVLGTKDWLKYLTLSIKNISDKNIISIDMDLWIKPEGKMLNGVSIPVLFRSYSKPTGNNALTELGEKKLGSLQPGEVVRVRISDRNMSAFGRILTENGAEDVERVKIEIRFVYFDDDTHWAFGKEAPNKKEGSVQHYESKQVLFQRFSDWIKYLSPIDTSRSRSTPFALIFPAGGRFFFYSF